MSATWQVQPFNNVIEKKEQLEAQIFFFFLRSTDLFTVAIKMVQELSTVLNDAENEVGVPVGHGKESGWSLLYFPEKIQQIVDTLQILQGVAEANRELFELPPRVKELERLILGFSTSGTVLQRQCAPLDDIFSCYKGSIQQHIHENGFRQQPCVHRSQQTK